MCSLDFGELEDVVFGWNLMEHLNMIEYHSRVTIAATSYDRRLLYAVTVREPCLEDVCKLSLPEELSRLFHSRE